MKTKYLLAACAGLAASLPIGYREMEGPTPAELDAMQATLDGRNKTGQLPPPEPRTMTLRSQSTGIIDCMVTSASIIGRLPRGHTSSPHCHKPSFIEEIKQATTCVKLFSITKRVEALKSEMAPKTFRRIKSALVTRADQILLEDSAV